MGRYADDPIWADVTPLPTDEGGPNPLAAIAYSEEYEETMSYLRAIMAAEEHSERALALTAHLIELNPAHYTVWLYRAATILALKNSCSRSDVDDDGEEDLLNREMTWLNETALANQKNYQIWQYRATLIDALGSADGEPEFLDRMLALDAKNYHVWSYRQSLVRRFSLWEEGELEFTERMLRADVRNNSVWNHRWFVVNAARNDGDANDGKKTQKKGVAGDAAVRTREVKFVQDAIRLAPQNESAWNYLRAIFRTSGEPIHSLRPFVEEFASLEAPDRVRSSHALEMLGDIFVETRVTSDETTQPTMQHAIQVLSLLANKYDPLRQNYWEYKRRQLLTTTTSTTAAAA